MFIKLRHGLILKKNYVPNINYVLFEIIFFPFFLGLYLCKLPLKGACDKMKHWTASVQEDACDILKHWTASVQDSVYCSCK